MITRAAANAVDAFGLLPRPPKPPRPPREIRVEEPLLEEPAGFFVEPEIPDAPALKKLEPLKLIRPEDFFETIIPSRAWIVRDWIPCGVVTSLYGDGGVGKSLILQQLQAAAAVGGEWCGLTVEPVRSVGFYCEDDSEELLRRQTSINKLLGLSRSDLCAMRMVSRIGDDNLLIVFDSRGRGELTPFYKQAVEQIFDEKAKLAIFDTASDIFCGNENDRGQVKQLIARGLGSIATKTGGAVILAAHPSRSGLSSGEGDGGTTGWNNAVRSRLYFSAPKPGEGEMPDHDARVLSRKKENYAARNAELKVRWKDGCFVADRIESDSYRPPVEDVFLRLLDQRNTQGRPVSPKPRASTYAPKIFSKASRSENFGFSKAQFEVAMERLFSAGGIKIETYKTSDRNLVERVIRAGK